MSIDTKIEAVLNEEIRPILNAHGGDIGEYTFQDGVFRFRFVGQCAHCPSAWITAEQLVAERLMTKLLQVREVLLVRDVDQELWDQAVDILKKRRALQDS